MKKLIDYTKILRSKNAGPLFITFDLIFNSREDMEYVAGRLTKEQISKAYDVSVEKINVALELAYNTTISLEEKISEESNFTILDYTEDETIDIQNDYMIKQIYMDLRETIKEILNPREYSIISYRFGIVNDVNKCPNPMTLEQVANILGVTRERIRQIEAQALRKLRIKEQGNKIKYLKNN